MNILNTGGARACVSNRRSAHLWCCRALPLATWSRWASKQQCGWLYMCSLRVGWSEPCSVLDLCSKCSWRYHSYWYKRFTWQRNLECKRLPYTVHVVNDHFWQWLLLQFIIALAQFNVYSLHLFSMCSSILDVVLASHPTLWKDLRANSSNILPSSSQLKWLTPQNDVLPNKCFCFVAEYK